jgi:hypothetical protein
VITNMTVKEEKKPDLGEKTGSVVENQAVSEPVMPEKIPFFRGTTFQALIVAFLFFSGPGMISALGTFLMLDFKYHLRPQHHTFLQFAFDLTRA